MSSAKRWVLGALIVGAAFLAWRGATPATDQALEDATAAARRGNVEEAMTILEAAQRPSTPNPSREALRVRLVAARGNVRAALVELARSSQVAHQEALLSVLATLYESLERAGLDPKAAPASLTEYALGFGSSSAALTELPERERVVIAALHAFETGQPIEVAALERVAGNSSELPRFIRIANAQGVRPPAGH